MTLPLWQKVSSAGKSSLGGGHSKLHVSRPYVANPFGYCMFEIVAHQPAYRAPDMTTLINKINPSSTSPLPTVYSPTLKRLIKSMLRKNPEHRPTAAELLKHLLQPYLVQCRSLSPIFLPVKSDNNHK
ncbi:serine/threonine-protein kinase Nek6-like isoform X3 [Actinidia eriantha]|uniref:serine/threonine-protein kinase Nek6-like isoform X3 n=1 Tax=Actinidia eriantha TaxID=165200 RepID=UPI00258BCE63|nr:serine/threonine-protein kinase Nek6-like isoform X3 [Actinidia eriantha]